MSFESVYNKSPLLKQVAHGRVNLLGEHTDYNHGLVLPMQINAYTEITATLNQEATLGTIRLFSEDMKDGIITRNVQDKKQNNWTDYVIGSLQVIEESVKQYKKEFEMPALDVYLTSNIPMGGGLSSSAALEVATLKLIRMLYTSSDYDAMGKNTHTMLPADFSIEEHWNDVNLAKLGQMAENNYVGLPCGLMDQLVISVGDAQKATMINFGDNDNPQYESVSLFDEVSFMIISSGYFHVLNNDNDRGYETRVKECQEGANILQVPHLSTIKPEQLDEMLGSHTLRPVIANRIRHVVEENARVTTAVHALYNGDYHVFAQCMNESHISQRDLYQVSIPEIDALVETALDAGALGARLTGGGFGGSIIIMVYPDQKDKIWEIISQKHNKAVWFQ